MLVPEIKFTANLQISGPSLEFVRKASISAWQKIKIDAAANKNGKPTPVASAQAKMIDDPVERTMPYST